MLSADLEALDSPLEVARPVLTGPLLAAGCAIGNAGINPAAVYVGGVGQMNDPTIELIAEVEDAAPALWPNQIRRGISFTPILAAAGFGPYAAGNLQELDGQSIGRHTLVRGAGGSLALDVELEDEVAGISVSTAGGDFDGDGLLDVAAMLLVPSINQDDNQARVFTALGTTLEGTRLAGQSEALAPDEVGTQRFLDSELFAADLDGDTFDEHHHRQPQPLPRHQHRALGGLPEAAWLNRQDAKNAKRFFKTPSRQRIHATASNAPDLSV